MYNASLAFFDTAGRFFQPMSAQATAPAGLDAHQKAQLEVAVTNLALAVELMLKALLLYTGRVVKPRTHDLLKLFEALPPELQQSIDREYRERGGESGTVARSLELEFFPAGAAPDEVKLAALRRQWLPGTDIRSVLANERHAFVVWRYLSEQAKPGEVTLVRVEYERLGVIINSMQRHFRVTNPGHDGRR